jgi:hypothetical protein
MSEGEKNLMSRSARKIGALALGLVLISWGCSTVSNQPTDDASRNPAFSSGRHDSPPPDDSNNTPTDNSNEVLQIATVNGTNDAHNDNVIDVHPGTDVVSLTADVFNSGVGENRTVEEFVWTDYTGTCNGSDAASCLDNSNFQVTDYGVNYYVPQNMTQRITLTVSNPLLPNSSDSIILNPVADYVPPTVIAVTPEQYTCSDFNEDCALAGQGRWIYVQGSRFFVPYTTDASWEPYNHGYWTWVAGDGWTWVSYDTWGWYTDHYGQWRHHGVYGWVWSPFEDRAYRPATVTWFYDGSHVGWYPYYDSYAHVHPYWGVEYGFDDGYWGGYQSAEFYGPYHPGFYHVGYGDFGQTDVWGHRATDIDVVEFYRGSYGNHAYGEWPGAADRDHSYSYMQNRVEIHTTVVDSHSYGSSQMRFPHPVNQVPQQYHPAADTSGRFGRPIPVGSVVAKSGGHEQVVQPTSNGRGISAPPMVKDNAGNVVALPPRTRQPAQPNPSNPVYHAPPVTEQPHPVFNPSSGGHNNGNGGNHNTPVTPPQHNTPVTPPEHNTPVTPPEHNTPVTPPVHNTPVTPPQHNTPVTPPTHTPPAPVHTTPPAPVHTTPPAPVHTTPPAPVHNNPAPVHNNPAPAPTHTHPAQQDDEEETRPAAPAQNAGHTSGRPPRDPASVDQGQTTDQSDIILSQ